MGSKNVIFQEWPNLQTYSIWTDDTLEQKNDIFSNIYAILLEFACLVSGRFGWVTGNIIFFWPH